MNMVVDTASHTWLSGQEGVTVPLSIVIATTKAWREIEPCLESFHKQAEAVGAEVLICDVHGEGLPPAIAHRYPTAKRVTWRDGSVFLLR
jgi:hypothetical protein